MLAVTAQSALSRLLNHVYTIQPVVKPVDNRLYRVNKHSTGCQTGLTTGLATVLNELLFVQPVVKPCLTNRFDKHGLTNRFDNGFDNRLYRVYKHLPGCQTGLTTGLTTGSIV